MRLAASAALLLTCVAGAAQAGERPLRLDLPPGSLLTAVEALGARTGVNIGASDPRLLARRLPALHLKGAPDAMVARIARIAHLAAVRVGPDSWRLVPEPPPALAHRPRPARREAPLDTATIIVRASKQNLRLADDPAEVIILDSDVLDRPSRGSDVAGLADRVPALGSTDWGAGQDKVFLRGVADSSFIGSSPALVGEYLGDLRMTYSAPDPGLRLYDVESVEILEGPQGTLYGMGTLGGLIRIEPRAPQLDAAGGAIWSALTATAHGGLGSEYGGIVNLPLAADAAGLRLVGYDLHDPGYIDDTGRMLRDVNSSRTRGGRAALRWRIAPGWSIDWTGFGQSIDNRDAPYADQGAPLLTRASRVPQPSYDRVFGGSMVVSGRIGGIRLRSATGIVSQSFGETFEVLTPGGREYLFAGTDRARLLSQETRLSGETAHGSWAVGASVLDSRDRQARDYGNLDQPAPLADLTNRVFEVTGFGEITRRLAGPLSLTLGARYSSDRLSGETVDLSSPIRRNYRVSQAARIERRFLPSVALLYHLDPATQVFVRYARGFRPGGLTGDAVGQTYGSDSVTTLELGARRGDPRHDRLAVSITGALSRWRNIQADLLDGLGLPYVANIGDGRIASLEASVSLRLTGRWALDASGFVTHNRLDPSALVAADGGADRLPNVAGDGAALTLDYTGPLARGGAFHAELGAHRVGRSLFGVGPQLAVWQGGYTTLAAGGDVRIGPVTVYADLSNLLDSHADTFGVGTPFAGNVRQQVTPLRPRTLHFGARYTF